MFIDINDSYFIKKYQQNVAVMSVVPSAVAEPMKSKRFF